MVMIEKRQPLAQRVLQTLQRFGLDTFILLLISMIVLASIFPKVGISNSSFSLPAIANYGISLIFFFYGLKLNTKQIVAGIRNWRLHLVVHSSTFILFPLILICAKPFFAGTSTYTLWLGAFFLASLPSTVSSSVVMVSIAEGNVPAAIFNASISSIAGVFITPLWMNIEHANGGNTTDFSGIIIKLALQILLPFALGLLLNKKLGAWADKYKKQLKYFDQTIILTNVFCAFCESFYEHMFKQIGITDLLVLAVCMVALFFIAYGVTSAACKLLSFNREDKITATFCGSKKSLMHGTVMSRVLFANSHITGVLLLPLMVYHALQLIMVSIIAQKLVKDKHTAMLVPTTPTVAV